MADFQEKEILLVDKKPNTIIRVVSYNGKKPMLTKQFWNASENRPGKSTSFDANDFALVTSSTWKEKIEQALGPIG